MKTDGETLYVWGALLLGVALVILSLLYKIEAPAPALTEWTEWAAKYVALIVAAQKLWKFADAMIVRLSR